MCVYIYIYMYIFSIIGSTCVVIISVIHIINRKCLAH